ncbi:hypothetical protein HZA55_00020 [Candidatus Poribacteria bacterium]|nr:hypothetical protein [Candidatus Poribacteria bacterium]
MTKSVKIFFLIILSFSQKIFSFEDSYKDSNDVKKQETTMMDSNKFNAIQDELDNLILQLRSGKTDRIIATYVPNYGVVVRFDFKKRIALPYKKTEGNEAEKENYLDMTALSGSILKRIAKFENIMPDDYVFIEVFSNNLLVHRSFQFKYLKNLYNTYAELNILQSILKIESDPLNITNTTLKDVVNNLTYKIVDIENDKTNPLLKIPHDIEEEVLEKMELKIIALYLTKFGILIHTTGQSIKNNADLNEITEELSSIGYKSAKKFEDSNWSVVMTRKAKEIVIGEIDLRTVNTPDEISNKINLWCNIDK